ncbi:SusD/RagB family nutrient-binding outer membrane lipoprotein [Chryseobacterium carnipullorum]|uniref:Starch-binding associating with outer membrane n=1 Tax=Chryseobacterium carnipullorum TaxID=1124835 RepID=A0A1M7HLB9_CHRCU|nr:SusD/RagB family nutrient-binding outer membrane lipoprotein [Chryseobacterium carnipullorum]AZA48547.1 SusD/RagB family nutrient-binding outer membrane lipoprotein [Chryseobacterium carnipullorum]AZA63472.1 SusD/RagB family nutrient-binding outer membrane lipoprotein [Chryseobacterium carnipullorum]SHM29254.1 Starch-binding associating with outer membrane [Chryseobacterium carnipullorum]STC92649.1 Starch-binding associating with outer membrane [Chryseobacterium carnipullorum]
MKKILIPILGMTTLLFFNSCSDDFLDVNKNVNEAYTNQVTPKDRLGAAETVVFRTQGNTMNRFGNLMMNAWAGNIYYYASPYGDEFRMRADSQFYDNIWDNLYLGVSNLQAVIDAPESAKYPHHVAVAKVMKAYYMQMIVDLYNDVPYTEAFKGQANKNPKYDKAKDVYKGLLAELNQALALIPQTPSSSNYNLAFTEDPIFQGSGATQDLATWRTFWTQMANTVKLKMLVRLSNCTDPEVITWRNAELLSMAPLTSNPANFISADVKIQPGFNPNSLDQRNPFYANFGRIDIDAGDIGAGFRQTFASEHIVNSLRGLTTETSGVSDGRISRLFIGRGLGSPSTAAGNIVGQPQGGTKQAGKAEGDFATLGLFLAFTNGTTGPNTSTALASNPGLVLTLSEVRFLQAEAAVVYPTTMAFNAQTSFNQGITESFTTFGSTAAASAAYLNAIAAKPGMGWAASANKIQAIQYQKWVALTNINPTETYISYTKTGFPQLPMPQGAYYTSRPKRLMYPQSEYISNTANVPNPSIDDMYNINAYSPFWLK